MADEVFMNTVPLANGTLAVGTSYVLAFFAPTDSLGGGITITRVGLSSNSAIAAASAPQFELVTLGTNSAVNGTICSASASAAYTAGTVRDMTITTAFVDAPYGVAFKRAQTAANGDTPVLTGFIQYVMGK